MKKLLILAVIAAVSPVAAGARATVIYNGGAPDQLNLWTASRGTGFEEAAESFTLSAGANTINDIHWWGGCPGIATSKPQTCPAGDFIISIHNDNGGLPGTVIFSDNVGNANQTATGATIIPTLNIVEYSYSTVIPDLTLTTGTPYWLGISNANFGAGNMPLVWGWETTDQSGVLAQRIFETWVSQGPGDLAFFLTGVPEPASLSLLGASLLGFAVARRRKTRVERPLWCRRLADQAAACAPNDACDDRQHIRRELISGG
jgi:hypothetical protein